MAERLPELRSYLVEHRIAGEVATSRQDNLRNIRRMLDDAPDYWFGLHRTRDWSYDDTLRKRSPQLDSLFRLHGSSGLDHLHAMHV